MTFFVLPLTIRSDQRDVDVLVELTGPTRLADVLPALIDRAGLPVGTTLHHGIGAVEGSWILGRAPMLAGRVLSTVGSDDVTTIGPVNLSCVAGPDAGGWVPVDDRPVLVGRGPDCDLGPVDPELSRKHARIGSIDQRIVVTDLGSVNGVHIDGAPRPDASTTTLMGGLIRLGGSVFRVTMDAEPAMLVVSDGAGRLIVSRPARVAPLFDHPTPPEVGPAPERTKRPLPLVAAVGGAAAGVGIAAITGLWTFLLLAALGPVMMLLSALSDRIAGRRSHRRARSDHARATAAEAELIEEAVRADRRDAWDRYPDPATLARRAHSGSVRLWERRRHHPDFLVLSLGVGGRPIRIVRAERPWVAEVPITVDLAAVGALGIAGRARPLVRSLLAQLVTLHSPADLHIVVFSDHDDLARCRDLPHAAAGGAVATFPTHPTAAAAVAKLLTYREERSVVVVLDDADRWRRTPRMNELLQRAAGAEPDLIAICISTEPAALPVECTAIAVVDTQRVRLVTGDGEVDAEPAGVSSRYLDDMVTALTPLIDPDSPWGGLPTDVSFSSLFAPARAAVGMARQWQRPSMTTAIGVSSGGPLLVDLERDGPHVLIAGTTGSGKSELLQTLVAGLACAAPPAHTAFLLIDYKGGAAFGRLADLPHTTGVITDLDEVLGTRALVSLRAEVRRREQLLADAAAPDLTVLRRSGEAPPALVVVVDEFATVAAERPEFLAGLLDLAQRGRSLGLHLILATQRPAGVLNPAIRANIGLRVCLRVADDADSIDVIETAAAARLTPDLPGRALLRGSRGRVTAFQVARVTTSPANGHRVLLRDDARATARTAGSTPSDLDEMVAAARTLARGTARPTPPWLPPLPLRFESGDPGCLGLLDRPSEQCQVDWRSPGGSILVLGPAGSGRSAALRRIACAAAASGADLLVVDAGDGLSDLADWEVTRSHLTIDDVPLIQRLVGRVAAEVRSRAACEAPPVLLIVDGWKLVGGPLDALDYGATMAGLADLAARGPAVGVTVIASGDPELEHHRMASSFSTVVRLGGAGRAPGRGRIDADEVQLARCERGTRPRGSAPRPDPDARDPVVVRRLPHLVSRRDLPAARPDAVPIGLGGDAVVPQLIDLAGPGGALLISGPRRSGVSTVLSVLAAGAVEAGIRVVRGSHRPVSPLPGVLDIDLRAGTAGLRTVLAEHQGSILLVADDVPDWSETGADLLERFVTVAGPGQYLALGCRLDLALRAHRGPIAEVAALRSGVLLQAEAADGALLDARIPRRTGPFRAGQGHLVHRGEAVPIQVARLENLPPQSGRTRPPTATGRSGGDTDVTQGQAP